jgi:hypothetical protein
MSETLLRRRASGNEEKQISILEKTTVLRGEVGAFFLRPGPRPAANPYANHGLANSKSFVVGG